MTEWEKVGAQYKELRPWTEIGLHWAKKYYSRMDDTDVYIVTMCKSLFFSRSLSNLLWYSSQPFYALLVDPS